MKIIKLHGCSGAGKTTAVRKFMERCPLTAPVHNSGLKVEAYICNVPGLAPVYVLGSYENTCGGMDTVGHAAEVMELVDKYAKMGHVIFEGLLQSTYYGAMGIHSQKYGDLYIYAFMDTPIELCLERVVARREASGRNNKFNPQLTRDKHETIVQLRAKLIRQGAHKTAIIDHTGDVGLQLEELLK